MLRLTTERTCSSTAAQNYGCKHCARESRGLKGCPNLLGLEAVVVDALRWEPHPTHLSVPEALELIRDIQPRRAYLTHVGHTLEHQTTNERIGPDVEVAFDGLELTL